MDGNRRWATERHLPEFVGHTEGAKQIKAIAKKARSLEIPYLTLFALSTENLKNRSQSELDHLFSLIDDLTSYLPDLAANNIRFYVIGDLSQIPQTVRSKLESLMRTTSNHTAMTITLAINYGGRDEIVRAVNKLIENTEIPRPITETEFSKHLDTDSLPDVDLMIRTGGDQRVSNFLPWQSIYAELYFTPAKWPAFTATDLEAAIAWFHEQKRNRGK